MIRFKQNKNFETMIKLDFKSLKIGIFIVILGCILGIITVLDSALALSIVLVVFLSLITFFLLHFQRFKEKNLYQLFLIVILIHFGIVLFYTILSFILLAAGEMIFLITKALFK